MNHHIKIMPIVAMFFVGIVVQTTYCMHDEEQTLTRQQHQKKIKLSKEKILFARPISVEGTDQISYAYTHELQLDPKTNFYTDDDKAYILITSNDLHTLPFTKLLNLSEKEIIEQDAAQNAIKAYQDKMTLLQKYPISSAVVVSTLSVATYAALDRLFHK